MVQTELLSISVLKKKKKKKKQNHFGHPKLEPSNKKSRSPICKLFQGTRLPCRINHTVLNPLGCSESQPVAQTIPPTHTCTAPSHPQEGRDAEPGNAYSPNSTKFPLCIVSLWFLARTKAGLSSLPQALQATAN